MKRLLASVCVAACALGLGAISAKAAYTSEITYNFDTREWSHEERGLITLHTDPRQWSSEDDGEVRAEKRARAKQRAVRHAPRTTRKLERAPTRQRAQVARGGRFVRRIGRTPTVGMRSLTGGGLMSGVASYYWQPQRVASGGWFNPNAMTAAHKTLPFGTRVRVTHAGTGRSVDVTINDRGPYIRGRVIDLSVAAAGALGMRSAGLAKVTLDVLGQ
jgi:rare lipoprotein A